MYTPVSSDYRRQFLTIALSGVAIFVALFIAKMIT
jgi:hypothetical protein